jgi:hypothetical protein
MIAGDELVKRLQNKETMSDCCSLSVISVTADDKNENKSSSKKNS